jgi:hypothetical protein
LLGASASLVGAFHNPALLGSGLGPLGIFQTICFELFEAALWETINAA